MVQNLSLKKFAGLALCLVVVSCTDGSSDEVPTGDPRTAVSNGRFGLTVHPSAAIDQKNTAYWEKSLLKGSSLQDGKPSEVQYLTEMSGCAFPVRPSSEKLVLINLAESRKSSQVYAYTKAQVEKQAKEFAEKWRRSGERGRIDADKHQTQMDVVNLIITDRSAPLHLVLGAGSRMIFNLHIADGVKIPAISLIASSSVGITNAPAETVVNALSPRNALTCKANPAQRPEATWQLVKLVREGNSDMGKSLNFYNNLYSDFDGFFKSNFGKHISEVAISAASASNILIGPPPADPSQRVTFQKIDGKPVRMTRLDHILIGGPTDFRLDFTAKVEAAAEQYTTGGLQSFNKGN